MTDGRTLAKLFLDRIDFEDLDADGIEDVLREYARLRARVDRDVMVYGTAFLELTDDDVEVLDPYEADPGRDDVELVLEEGDIDAVYGTPPVEKMRAVMEGFPSMWAHATEDEERLESIREEINADAE